MYKTAQKHIIKKQEKAGILQKLQKEIEDSKGIIIVNYEGVTATQFTDIRRNLKKYNSKLKVVNNKLFLLALKNRNLQELEKFVYKAIGVIFCYSEDDVVNVVKYLVETSNQIDKLKLSGGYIFNNVVDPEKIKEISKLPSKQELVAKAVYLIKSPLINLIVLLKNPLNSLVNILSAKAKKDN